jgi:hypothetical protein
MASRRRGEGGQHGQRFARFYAVTKNGERSFWQPIGAAWVHSDGWGFNVKIDYGWLATGQMPSLRDRGRNPARCHPAPTRYADLET